MRQSEFEKALLAEACWRLSKSNDTNELLAIGCTLRNWVVPHMGQVGHFYKSYLECIETFYDNYPKRRLPPTSNDPALIDLDSGLLWKIDEIYDNKYPDLTSSDNNLFGARYFGRPATSAPDSWFTLSVLNNQGAHPLIGSFGGSSFYE